MHTFTSRPAMIQQVDATRGDLFAVVSEGQDYVVQVQDPVAGADAAAKNFVSGVVLLDANGAPAYIAMLQEAVFTPCTRLMCRTTCPECFDAMQTLEDSLSCETCKLIIPLPTM